LLGLESEVMLTLGAADAEKDVTELASDVP
jgi:hypothetical protein